MNKIKGAVMVAIILLSIILTNIKQQDKNLNEPKNTL